MRSFLALDRAAACSVGMAVVALCRRGVALLAGRVHTYRWKRDRRQLAADRTQATTLMHSLRGLRERQHYRLSKTQRQALGLAEQALEMFLNETIEEL